MPSKIKKGDNVQVVSGKYQGRRGEVLRVIPKDSRVVIAGVNKVKRHTKPSQANPTGSIIEKEAPIHVSNVMIVDPKDDKPCRVGFKKSDDKWVRFSKRTETLIPDVVHGANA